MVAASGITIAFTIYVTAPAHVVATGGTSAVVGGAISFTGGAAAATTIGIPAATAAVAISIAAGGVAVLNKLRTYKIIERSHNKLIIQKT